MRSNYHFHRYFEDKNFLADAKYVDKIIVTIEGKIALPKTEPLEQITEDFFLSLRQLFKLALNSKEKEPLALKHLKQILDAIIKFGTTRDYQIIYGYQLNLNQPLPCQLYPLDCLIPFNVLNLKKITPCIESLVEAGAYEMHADLIDFLERNAKNPENKDFIALIQKIKLLQLFNRSIINPLEHEYQRLAQSGKQDEVRAQKLKNIIDDCKEINLKLRTNQIDIKQFKADLLHIRDELKSPSLHKYNHKEQIYHKVINAILFIITGFIPGIICYLGTSRLFLSVKGNTEEVAQKASCKLENSHKM